MIYPDATEGQGGSALIWIVVAGLMMLAVGGVFVLVRHQQNKRRMALRAAQRELREETGYVAGSWNKLLSLPSSATISDNYGGQDLTGTVDHFYCNVTVQFNGIFDGADFVCSNQNVLYAQLFGSVDSCAFDQF